MSYLKVNDELSNDNDLVLDGYIALFGGTDLVGEHFAPDTKFDSSYTSKNVVLIDWEHGLEPDGVKNQPGVDDVLGKVDWLTARNDDIGLLARHVLDRRESYVSEFVEPLARAGLLGSSSEAVPKGITREPGGKITAWPIKRQSLTVNPAEPRLLTDNQLQVIKSLSEKYPALKSLIPIDAKDGVTEPEKSDIIIESIGDNQMSDKDTDPIVDDAYQKSVNSRFDKLEENLVKQGELLGKAVAALEKIPAKTTAVIVEDEADKAVKAHPHKLGFNLLAIKSKVMGRELTNEQKAILGQNESVPADGGFLVATEQDTSIDKKMHDEAVLSSRVNQRTIGSGANSVDFYGRKENSRADGSRFGGIQAYRVAEGAPITSTQMEWYKYNLKPSKYAAVVYATDEVANDAALLQGEVMDAVPSELAFLLDDDIMNGVSAGYPKGILQANCLRTVAAEGGQAAATVIAENISKMWAAMWSKSKANAVWLINTDVNPQLDKLNFSVGTGGQLVYMPPGGLSTAPYGTLKGRPIIETEFNATLGTVGDIMLVDLSQYKLANVGGLQTASSIHVQFLTDQMVWRFTTRYDGQTTWESALTPKNGTNTVSPFVALATRS